MEDRLVPKPFQYGVKPLCAKVLQPLGYLTNVKRSVMTFLCKYYRKCDKCDKVCKTGDTLCVYCENNKPVMQCDEKNCKNTCANRSSNS